MPVKIRRKQSAVNAVRRPGWRFESSGLVDLIYGQEHERGAHILIVYRAEISGGVLQPADDVDDARFFSQDDLPPLAFQTTQKILNRLGSDFSASI